MTSDAPDTFTSLWPADPQSAWQEARQSPDRFERWSDRPDVDAADAASIVDWIEDQRSMLPMFAIASAAVGVIILGGLIVGVLPFSGQGASSGALWVVGICLMIASVVLWAWELVSRRRKRSQPPKVIPEAEAVLCQLYPTKFNIHDGDGYRETCIAIDADMPDEQAARVLTASRIWIARLVADPDASIQARNEAWLPSGATVFTSAEIFGPGAEGGYLVRRPNPPADGWGVLLTPRRPAKLVGQLRFADIRQWTGAGWSL